MPECHNYVTKTIKPTTSQIQSLLRLLSFGFFTKHFVNDLAEFTVQDGFGRLTRGVHLILQVQHEPLKPVAARLDFFNGNFQLPDFFPQNLRNLLFVHMQKINTLLAINQPVI